MTNIEKMPKYVVQRKLGAGSFGTVYEVIGEETKEKYALKIGKRSKNSQLDQLINEINAYHYIENNVTEDDLQYFGKLNNSFQNEIHVILILNLYKENVYDLLSSRFESGKYRGLELPLLQKYLRDLASGLYILHKINIVHCDLKPENMVITDDERIKIIDFGSSFLKKATFNGAAQSLFYRAPEAFLKLELTSAIDIWSFGCIAFELYKGYPLFCGKDELNTLQYIQIRLGKFPHKLISSSPLMKEYFDSNGNVRNIENFKDRLNFGRPNLEQLMFSMPAGDEIAVELLYNLVKICLNFDVEKRANSKDIVDHPFLQYNFN